MRRKSLFFVMVLCGAVLLSGHITAHLSAAQQVAPSLEQQEAEFERLDAIRKKTEPDSAARAVAAADAAKQASALAWQSRRANQTARASEWLRRQVELQRESDVIGANISTSNAIRLIDAVDAALENGSGWSKWNDLSRLLMGADVEETQTVKQHLLSLAADTISVNLTDAWKHLLNQADYSGQLRVTTLDVRWSRKWVTIDRNSPEAEVKLADALDDLGVAERRLGNLASSREHHLEALALRRSVPVETPRRNVFTTLRALAELELDGGQRQRARELLEQAVVEAQSASLGEGDSALFALESLHSIPITLGHLLEIEGRYAEAFHVYREGEVQARRFAAAINEQAERAGRPGRSSADVLARGLRASEILLRGKLGEVGDAHADLLKLVQQYADAGESGSAAALLTRMASLDLDMGRLDRAEESLKFALDHFRESGFTWGQVSTHLRLVSVLERQGRASDAVWHAAEALSLAQTGRWSHWIGRAATAALRVGLADQGAAGISDLLRLVEENFDALSPEEQAAALVAQGRVEEAVGNPDPARLLYARAADHLEALRFDPLSQERFYDVGARHEAYEHLIRLAVDRGDAEEALRQLFRSRRQDLQSAHNPALFTSSRPELQALLDRLRSLHAQIQSRSSLLSRLRAATPRDAGLVRSTEAELHKFQTEWRAVSDRVARLEPGYGAYVGGEPPSLRDVQRGLPPGTALVVYMAPLDAELIILVVTPDTATFHRSPVTPARIWELTNAAVHALQGKQTQMDRTWQSLTALHTALMAPIEDRLNGIDRLQILPTRLLHNLPFHALAKRTASGVRYLLEDKEVIYQSGAAFGATGRVTPSDATGPPAVVLFGNPTKDLTHAQAEVEDIRKLFPNARVFMRDQATPDAVLTATADASVVHFAAHGRVNIALPASSRLRLAPDEPSGYLTVSDIRGLPLGSARLVTLSACQSSLGQGDPRGVSASSLSDAFLVAGADTVVGTLWEVDDVSTRDLMLKFYAELARGACKVAALRSAQLALLRGGRYAHPYHWAAFLLTGDAEGVLQGSAGCTSSGGQ